MARKLTWEVPLNCWPLSLEATQATATIPSGVGPSSPYPSVDIPLVQWSDVEGAEDDSIWVERIIGQTCAYLFGVADPPSSRLMMERVHTGMTFFVDTNEVPVYQADLFNRDGADERFLWNRVRTVYRGQDNGASFANPYAVEFAGYELEPGAHPYWTTIDIKVGRHLRAPETLALTVQTPLDTSEGLHYFAWLRVLLAR